VHGIKGSSGVLGAHDLHAAATTLNLSLKQGAFNQAEYATFKQILMRVRASLAVLQETDLSHV